MKVADVSDLITDVSASLEADTSVIEVDKDRSKPDIFESSLSGRGPLAATVWLNKGCACHRLRCEDCVFACATVVVGKPFGAV
jgi:hypothetical protein